MSDLNSQARRIFYESLDCPQAEWDAFLDRACGGDGELRRLAEALLKAHESPATFLERPIVGRTRLETSRSATDSTATRSPVPEEEVSATESAVLGDDRYRVLRSHAQGGLGEVFVAEDRELNREVALKEIRSEYARDKDFADRFLLEAQVTGHLEHPGIVPVYGAGHHSDGRPYYAMRFIHGESFDKAISQFHGGTEEGEADSPERSVAFRQLLGRFVDVCQAAAYAHSKGVIHRDLKPGNVMLGRFGETLIVDWGLARVLDNPERNGDSKGSWVRPTVGPASATRAGSALGTPAYMSPEQAAGDRDRVGPASDVYSLGAMLYEILTGKPSFDGNLVDVLDRIQRGKFSRPREVTSDVPAALEAVCLKAMATDPADRYADAQEIARDVESWLADEPPSAWREPLRARAARWIRKHQRLTAVTLTLAFVAVIAAAAAGMWYQNARAQQQARQTQIARETTVELDRAEDALDALSKSLADRRVMQKFISDLGGWRRQVEAARTALGRAKLVAADDEVPLDAAVGERMQALRVRLQGEEKHLKLAERLDRIRLDASKMGTDGVIEMAAAGDKYAGIFREVLGVDIEHDDAAQIANKIHRSPFRTILVATLDHWAICSQTIHSHQVQLLPRILEVARKADPDPWRDRFRDINTWRAKDRGVITAALAKEVDVAAQSPHTLEALVFKLPLENRRPLLKRALLAYPGDFWLNFDAGRVSKEPAARLGYLQAAIAIRPKTVLLYVRLGLELTRSGDLDGAIAAYRKAMEVDPAGAAGAYVNLAGLFINQQRWGDAAENYRMALKLGVTLVGVRTNLATCLMQMGRDDEAIETYRAALKANPKHLTALGGLGQVLLRSGRYAEAIPVLQQVLRLLPRNDPHRRLLMGHLAQARAHVALANEKPTRLALSKGRVEVSGELKAGNPKEASPPNRGSPRAAYLVRLEAGNHYQIDAVGGFGKVLRVEDEKQFCLSINEYVAIGDRRRARLVFSPETSGDYRVVVAARLPKYLGRFSLAIGEVREDGPPQVFPVNPPANNPNQTNAVSVELGVSLEAGRAYRFEATGKPRPHFTAISSPAGRKINQAPEIGPRETGMVFLDLTPQKTGQYTVRVESQANVADRKYTLRVHKFRPPAVKSGRSVQ
jgi:serine/threonine protein kinase/Flp pilus assembly protein TadD